MAKRVQHAAAVDVTTKKAKTGKHEKDLTPKGSIMGGVKAKVMALPPEGKILRYLITSAQIYTKVHEKVWENLQALASYYDAKIMVGTFSYDKKSYGADAIKRGADEETEAESESEVDPRLEKFIEDEHVQLGKGLVWCGKVNIMPTTSNPLSGFETFSGRDSSIFPHVKFAMRSVASLQGSGAKLIYTTGTITQRNYIQKKAGILAEFHHCYGALIVEVNSKGIWKIRQIDAEDETGVLHDLTLRVSNGVVTEGHRVEAITWGDLHATCVDPQVLRMAAEGKNSMLNVLRPRFQFIHDLFEGASVNHHGARNPLDRFRTSLRGLTEVKEELIRSAFVLSRYDRKDTEMVVVNANHDRWLDRWLDSFNPQFDDARNAEIYHDASAARYRSARTGQHLNVLEYLIRKFGNLKIRARFLQMDESFLICGKKIECGQHGDLGPNGSRGTSIALSKVGRRANIGHTHTAGIWDGLYVAGTSTDFRMGYNHGPSSWTHSHVVVYPNGKRTIITMFEGEWRA